jgi:endonuclease-3 related protein
MAAPRRWSLPAVYARLFAAHGPQHWWPAQTPFEVMVGAVLTQNTAWTNVERAIANLRAHDRLDAAGIVATRSDRLAGWLRPSGYFNVKAARLKHLCRWYLDNGGHAALARRETGSLRRALLDVHGIGRETADDILLYAFARPVFVIDAYTRRLLARLALCAGDEPYEELREAVESALRADTALYQEYHALIVHHAKVHCRVRPLCAGCVLRRGCPAATLSRERAGKSRATG